MRTEKDLIGEVKLNDEYLFGIHTYRAEKNFCFSNDRIDVDIFRALIEVKKAAISANYKAGLVTEEIYKAVIASCDQVLQNPEQYLPVIHPLQGGAGTSTNMAANELLANLALKKMNYNPGRYDIISPLEHINLCQSTNDVYPTAVKIALIKNLHQLHRSVESLLRIFLKKEKEFAPYLKVGRTELQDAVPISVGQEFASYAEALARFRWRLEKAIEWVREVNISGTAVGTGLNADELYSFYVISELRTITGENIVLARNLIDATQNLDPIVEVSGIVKTGAVSVKKICSDLRLMASGPDCGLNEIVLPSLQAGSSIMPGKVNPVILEACEQVCLQIISGDLLIGIAVAESNFELPQFLPLIADQLIKNVKLFSNALGKLEETVATIKIRTETLNQNLMKSEALATLLAIYIGYDRSSELVKAAREENIPLVKYLVKKKLIDKKTLQRLLTPEMLASRGVPVIKKDDQNKPNDKR